MGDEVMQQEDGAVTSARKRQAICGASSTSVCVLPPRHEGLCSYWADSELNKQLKAELAQARSEIERARQQKVTDDELYRRCDQRWIGAEQRLKETQAERDAALAVVEAVRQWNDGFAGNVSREDRMREAIAAFDKARQ